MDRNGWMMLALSAAMIAEKHGHTASATALEGLAMEVARAATFQEAVCEDICIRIKRSVLSEITIVG